MGKYAADDRRIWLRAFNNSKVNGAPYRGDYLPAHSWAWPIDTYLQRRLRILRAHTDTQPTAGTCGGIENRQGDRMLISDVVMLSETPSSSHGWDNFVG